MTYALIRAQILSTIEAVDDIGEVHDYRRHSTTWKEIFDRHKDTAAAKLLNWEITKQDEVLTLEAVGNAVSTEPFYRRTHGISILGVQAVDEPGGPVDTAGETPSEKEFQDLVEAVVVALRQNNFLGNTTLLQILPQVPIIGHQKFGSTFVHTCQIVFVAVEKIGG